MASTSPHPAEDRRRDEKASAPASASEPATPRSGEHPIPGEELPAFVYVSVFLAFAWILIASWLAFAGGADADLALAVAGVLTVVFFALPVLVRMTAASHSRARRQGQDDFLRSRVETATGPLTGASAWLQVLIIPLALALAATMIGVTAMVMHG
jgi:hypothetical protein